MNRVTRSFLISAASVVFVVGGVGAASMTARADGEVVATGGHETSGPLPGGGDIPQLPKPGDAQPTVTADPTLDPGSGSNPGGTLPDPGAPGTGVPDPGAPDPGAGNPGGGNPGGSDPGVPDPGAGNPGGGNPGGGNPGAGNPGGGDSGGVGNLIQQIIAMIMKFLSAFTGGK